MTQEGELAAICKIRRVDSIPRWRVLIWTKSPTAKGNIFSSLICTFFILDFNQRVNLIDLCFLRTATSELTVGNSPTTWVFFGSGLGPSSELSSVRSITIFTPKFQVLRLGNSKNNETYWSVDVLTGHPWPTSLGIPRRPREYPPPPSVFSYFSIRGHTSFYKTTFCSP